MKKNSENKKRVLLLTLPERMSNIEYPSLGVLYISSMFRKNNIIHDILDLRLFRNWKKVLADRIVHYSIAGISCTTPEAGHLHLVSGIIKKHNSKCIVVLGGPHATIMGEEVLRDNKDVDYCLKGEGEYSFADLIKGKPKPKIPGLVYRKGKEVKSNKVEFIENLDALPFPNYSKINLKDYFLPPETFRIITSRGCPYQCTYCSKSLGARFRARSPENIADEIDFLKKKYNLKQIRFVDDNFSMDIARAKLICKEIIKRNLSIKWWCPNGMRIDRLDRELLSLMKKSGCTMITIGIESVNNEVLKEYKKNTTKERIIDTINLIKEFNIPIEGFFLISGVKETKKDVLDYLKFAKEHGLRNICFSMLVPLPKSEIYDWISKNGYWEVKDPLKAISNEVSAVQFAFGNKNIKALFSTPEMSAREKEEMYHYALRDWAMYISKRSYIDRISYFCRRFHLNFVFNLFDKYPLLMRLLGR